MLKGVMKQQERGESREGCEGGQETRRAIRAQQSGEQKTGSGQANEPEPRALRQVKRSRVRKRAEREREEWGELGEPEKINPRRRVSAGGSAIDQGQYRHAQQSADAKGA
jgi:hypothetical protein